MHEVMNEFMIIHVPLTQSVLIIPENVKPRATQQRLSCEDGLLCCLNRNAIRNKNTGTNSTCDTVTDDPH